MIPSPLQIYMDPGFLSASNLNSRSRYSILKYKYATLCMLIGKSTHVIRSLLSSQIVQLLNLLSQQLRLCLRVLSLSLVLILSASEISFKPIVHLLLLEEFLVTLVVDLKSSSVLLLSLQFSLYHKRKSAVSVFHARYATMVISETYAQGSLLNLLQLLNLRHSSLQRLCFSFALLDNQFAHPLRILLLGRRDLP